MNHGLNQRLPGVVGHISPKSVVPAMPEAIAPDKDVLKQALKEALVETVTENQDMLRAVVADVLEDLAFGDAMREGEETEVVSRERIFGLLEDEA